MRNPLNTNTSLPKAINHKIPRRPEPVGREDLMTQPLYQLVPRPSRRPAPQGDGNRKPSSSAPLKMSSSGRALTFLLFGILGWGRGPDPESTKHECLSAKGHFYPVIQSAAKNLITHPPPLDFSRFPCMLAIMKGNHNAYKRTLPRPSD